MKAINNEVPFFRPSLFFVAGISFQLLFHSHSLIWTCLAGLGFLALVLSFFVKRQSNINNHWNGLVFCVLMFSIGMAAVGLRQRFRVNDFNTQQEITLVGTLDNPPKETPKTVKSIVKCTVYGQNTEPFLVSIYFSKDSLSRQLLYGDRLLIHTKLQPIKNKGNPYEFDMERYMAMKGVFYQAYAKQEQWRLLDRGNGNFLFRIANRCQKWLMHIFRKNGFDNREFAVASALTLGYTDEIDGETRSAFSASGAMHVLSVSGLHVGVVYAALSFMLGFLRRYRWGLALKTVIEISFLWFFAFLSGLSPAVERSAFMLSLVVVGKAYRQETNIFNILLASLFFLLAYDPNLLTDVGFQLSYLAMASLLYFFPYINAWFTPKNYLIRSAWSMTAAALAAQIGTLPLSLYYFHQFPNLFLISNIVAILLSTIILYGSALLFFVSWSALLSFIFAKVLWWATWLLNWFIFWIEDQHYSVIERISFTSTELVLSYLAILFFSVFLAYRKRLWLSFALYALIASFGFRAYDSWQLKDQHRLIVFSTINSAAVCSVHGKKVSLIGDSSFIHDKEKMSYLIKGMLTAYQIRDVQLSDIKQTMITTDASNASYSVLQLQGKKLFVLRGNALKPYLSENKLAVDFLVLSGDVKLSIEKLNHLFSYKQLIIDSSVPRYRRNGLIADCQERGLSYHSVFEQGAWVLNLN